MGAQVEEVSAQAVELAETAQQVQALVARFRLDAAATWDDDDAGQYEPVQRRRADDWTGEQPAEERLHRAG